MNYVFFKSEGRKVVATKIVSEKVMHRIDDAARNVMRIYRVEEIFHMIMTAVMEFNSLIFLQADQNRIAEDSILEHELFRIRVNQCAATFLTSLEMYQWYLNPDRGEMPFTLRTDQFADERFEICKTLRNYIQHISTVGINTSMGVNACACGEKLSSFSVAADVIDMKKNKDKMKKATWRSLEKFIDGKAELNLFEIFNGVVDVLFGIQKNVRASREYAVNYTRSAVFLANMQSKLWDKGFVQYRYEGDAEYISRGWCPYLYDRERTAIDYLQQRYGVDGNSRKAGFYATTAPQKDMINRMAEADRLVEHYVKQNGIVAIFPDHSVTNSDFTTEKMRKWYIK